MKPKGKKFKKGKEGEWKAKTLYLLSCLFQK